MFGIEAIVVDLLIGLWSREEGEIPESIVIRSLTTLN